LQEDNALKFEFFIAFSFVIVLTKEATNFSNAYCPNAMCSPCRASVLTGKIPSQHGVHTWIDDDCASDWPETWNAIAEFDTLPEQLSREGYHTALMGKYHLGDAKSAKDMFDDGVGRIAQALKRNRLFEDTLFIYTSDHGMSLGQHGFWGQGRKSGKKFTSTGGK